MYNPESNPEADNYDYLPPKECAIEVYHCYFCKYKNDMRSLIEHHYFFEHEENLKRIEGMELCRRIDLLITNGEKSYDSSVLYQK